VCSHTAGPWMTGAMLLRGGHQTHTSQCEMLSAGPQRGRCASQRFPGPGAGRQAHGLHMQQQQWWLRWQGVASDCRLCLRASKLQVGRQPGKEAAQAGLLLLLVLLVATWLVAARALKQGHGTHSLPVPRPQPQPVCWRVMAPLAALCSWRGPGTQPSRQQWTVWRVCVVCGCARGGVALGWRPMRPASLRERA
jgi:hypothetical protein